MLETWAAQGHPHKYWRAAEKRVSHKPPLQQRMFLCCDSQQAVFSRVIIRVK